ncbi:MAG: hypothetical protein AAF594_17915 [Bacteroidota bacterium]
MTLVVGLVAALFTVACDDTAPSTTADPAAEAAAAAAKEAEAAAEAAKEAELAAAAAAEAKGMAIADLMAAKADQMGKAVTVSAVYASHEMHEEMAHVTLAASTDEGADTLLCAMADAAALEGIEPGAEMTVQGTLADKDGAAVLEGCAPKADAEAAAEGEGAEAPAEGAEAPADEAGAEAAADE